MLLAIKTNFLHLTKRMNSTLVSKRKPFRP
jgi:hypothetical protein